jgi:hypothetical protein
MNSRTKSIVKFLDADGSEYKLHNLIKKNGDFNIAIEKLLAEMPKVNKSTEHYTIDAYVDMKIDSPVAYSGWDMLGGPDPDKYLINGQKGYLAYLTRGRKARLEKVEHEFYKKYKYISSVENQNYKINLYTL